MADVGMRWLLESRPDIRPDLAINEGGGERLPLRRRADRADRQRRREGHLPGARGRGRRGRPRLHARRRRQRRTPARRAAAPGRPRACPTRSAVAAGGPRRSSCCSASRSPTSSRPSPGRRPCTRPSPTRCRRWSVRRWRRPCSAGSTKRNVMPARASVELDCRILPGTTEADVERDGARPARRRTSPTSWSWPEQLVAGSASPPTTAADVGDRRGALGGSGDDAPLLPMLCTGFTDSVYLRAAGTPRRTASARSGHLGRGARRRLPQRRRAGARRRPAAVGRLPRRPGPPAAGLTLRYGDTFSMFLVTASMVCCSSSVGLNSTTSVPAYSCGVCPGPT